MKANPVIVLAVIGGAVLAFVLGNAKPFEYVGKVQFWKKSQRGNLQTFLSKASLKDTGSERVWELVPGVPPGGQSALAQVQAIQQKGAVMTSSAHLLEPGSSRRMIAELTIPEFASLVTGTEIAVLPWLV